VLVEFAVLPLRAGGTMFVRVLGSVWAGGVASGQTAGATSPSDDDLRMWLGTLGAASPAAASDLVVAAEPQRVSSAARWLLTHARSALSEDGPVRWQEIADLGVLLLRIVERGHGTEFPGSQLAEAHSRMLLGLGRHLSDPSGSRPAYQQAAREYLSRGESLLSGLAQLGAATAGWATLLGGDQDNIRAQLTAVAAADPGAAAVLEAPLDGYLSTLRAIAVLRAPPDSSAGPGELAGSDTEAVSLLELAAFSSLDDVAAAARLARVADELSVSLEEPSSVLASLGQSLLRQRRWPGAAALLEESHARHPGDRDLTAGLARAWLEMDRWDDARTLLVSLLASPPGPQDADILQILQNATLLRDDPEAQHWQELLAGVDPSRTIAGQVPSAPAKASPEPLRARFRDGQMDISREFLELPEDERPVHMTAAIVAGSPDGLQLLTELEGTDPAMAERVMHLLGLERLTAAQAQVKQHIHAGEEHFRHGRFEDAAGEYQQALELDPDEATALLYLGDTCYRRGLYELAQAYFEESLAVAPSPQAYRFLGDAVVFSGGSRERARQCYEEALGLDPSYGGAKNALQQLREREREEGSTATRLGGRAAAQAGATAAIDANPPAETPVRDEAAAHSTPSVPSALRWSDSRSPSPLPGQGEVTAPRPSGPRSSQSLDTSDSPASPTSPQASPEQEASQGISPPDADSGSVGDRLVRAMADQDPQGVGPVIDDDNAFARWLAAASPDAIARAIMSALAVAFQYEAKDRNLARWAHWVQRRVQLAEALPPGYGPDQAPMQLGRDRLLADAYSGRASVLYAQGRLAEAREWWERAADLLKAEQAARARSGLMGESEFDRIFTPQDPQASVFMDLVRVCRDLGDPVAAGRYADLANELESARPTTESMIDGAIAGGDAEIRHGNPDEALRAFHWALDQAEEDAPNQVVPRPLAASLNALGRCHHQLKLNRSALEYFNRARRLNERSGNAVRLTWDFREIGRVYRARPDLGDAREAFEQSVINASIPAAPTDEFSWTANDGSSYRITAADRVWASLLELGGLLEDRDNLEDAVAFFDLATRIADVARASAVDDAQRVAIANQRIEAFNALTRLNLRRALAGGPAAATAAEDAWRANEAMRARSFLDALGDDEIVVPAEVPAALVEQEAAALEHRRRLVNSGDHDIAFWDGMGRVQADLEAIWDHMLAVTPTAAGYVEVRRSKPASAADIRSMIAADDRPTVLASLTPLGPDRLAVIALRPDSPAPVIASQPTDLARLTRFVNENLGTAGRVRELADDLGDLFHHEMQPLTSALAQISDPGEILVICPFGALNYLPLAALQIHDTALVERNPLAILPNASLARALRIALGTPAPVPARVFGDPTGDLAGAREEATVVSALFGTRPILGSEASRAAVTQALTLAGTVHIAAHAHFDAEDPLSSGIRLADGRLSAREILTMSAPALSLVTLSACETGVSQTNPAQELLGLTRALLFVGADSLVVSLWKVPDAATVEVMSAFYGRLQQGARKTEALQAAELEARELYGAQRFDQWAGFELVGEWR
jgi:CHAT domain-containing protein/thioredoxin-like negative regulator of GroEL